MDFNIARLPAIQFGSGKAGLIPALVESYGNSALLVQGGQFLDNSPIWQSLQAEISQRKITLMSCRIKGEPSPQLIDDIVAQHANAKIDCVLGIGGGSVLDAAKAIAGLLKVQRTVMDYLEGVGPELPYVGPAVPFIAVPTTAGTGSEATKNAVLSVQDKTKGFKKSFRDEKLVAQIAVVDPDFLDTCPPALIAANGMDAFTQLLESYVSSRANEFTNALAMSGMRAVKDSLLPWYDNASQRRQAQAQMAYASLLSGITLAQVGLGSVHGLASPLGAFYPIPHGVVCGTLLAEATAMNIRAMEEREPENIALRKYAEVGRLLSGNSHCKPDEARAALVSILRRWCQRLQLESLSCYGVEEKDLDHVVKHCRGSSMRTNPIVLSDEEIKELLISRL